MIWINDQPTGQHAFGQPGFHDETSQMPLVANALAAKKPQYKLILSYS
jgi:hypothetical protein